MRQKENKIHQVTLPTPDRRSCHDSRYFIDVVIFLVVCGDVVAVEMEEKEAEIRTSGKVGPLPERVVRARTWGSRGEPLQNTGDQHQRCSGAIKQCGSTPGPGFIMASQVPTCNWWGKLKVKMQYATRFEPGPRSTSHTSLPSFYLLTTIPSAPYHAPKLKQADQIKYHLPPIRIP